MKDIKWNIPLIIQICLVSALIKVPSIALAVAFLAITVVEAFRDIQSSKAMVAASHIEERLNKLSEALNATSDKLVEIETTANEAKASSSKLQLANGMKTTSYAGR